MTLLLFVGPTLAAEKIAEAGSFVCLPPVAQGDLYRAALRRPRAIGVIDGYFSGAPSVWHKEILWAISQGIPVFGSASMGALRAAELHAFGMRGVGRIFEAFRDGELEDDDEVAVVHGPADLGYLVASEAMVNIRATLARAEQERILSGGSRLALETFAKSLFFPQRGWDALLQGACEILAETELAALKGWLPEGRVDQKRADALAMLAAMLETGESPKPVGPGFKFEWTHFWDEFVHRCAAGHSSGAPSPQQRVIEELRLEDPKAYARVEGKALLRMVATNGVGRAAPRLERSDLRASLSEIRADLGLFARADLDRWMAENNLDETALERLVADEAVLNSLRDRSRGALEPYILDELRLSGDYERLARRGREKADALAVSHAEGARAPSAARTIALRLWYFEQRLRQSVPEDIEAFARRHGFRRVADLDDALHRERLFLDARPQSNST